MNSIPKMTSPLGNKAEAARAFMEFLVHSGWEFDDGECPACVADYIADALSRMPPGPVGTFGIEARVIHDDMRRVARTLDSVY